MVFFMQCGFALLEAGTVRAKNTKNILLKNLLDACVGAIIWWGWGYSLAVRDPSPTLPEIRSAPYRARNPRACLQLAPRATQHLYPR